MSQDKKIEPEVSSSAPGAGLFRQWDVADKGPGSQLTLMKTSEMAVVTGLRDSGPESLHHEKDAVIRPKVGLPPSARKRGFLTLVETRDSQSEALQSSAVPSQPLNGGTVVVAALSPEPLEASMPGIQEERVSIASSAVYAEPERLNGVLEQETGIQEPTRRASALSFSSILASVALVAASVIGVLLIFGGRHASVLPFSASQPVKAQQSSPAIPPVASPAAAPKPGASTASQIAHVTLPVIPPASASPLHSTASNAAQSSPPSSLAVSYVSSGKPDTVAAAAAPFVKVSSASLQASQNLISKTAAPLGASSPSVPSVAPAGYAQPAETPSPKELFSIINKD